MIMKSPNGKVKEKKPTGEGEIRGNKMKQKEQEFKSYAKISKTETDLGLW